MRSFSWTRLVNLLSVRSLYSLLQLRQGIHVPIVTTKHLPQTDPPVWRIWCNNNDTCGLTCAILCWVFLLYADFVFLSEILSALSLHLRGIQTTAGANTHTASYTVDITVAAHAIIFNTFVILALISHTRCMLSDPGAIPHHTHPLPDNSSHHRSTVCLSCSQSYKPPRAHHCSLCGRCIYKMDHHCPWINNCIGIANQKYFLLFLIYVFLAAIYCIGITVYTSLQCKLSLHQCYDPAYSEWYLTVQSMPLAAHGRLPGVSSSPPRVSLFPFLNLIITMMLCLLFGLFTVTMFGGQMYAILSDSPQIEQWQKERDSYNRRATASLTRSPPEKNTYPIHTAQQALSAAAATLQPVGEALVKDANVYNNPAASVLYATYPLNTTDIATDSAAVEMNDMSSQQVPLIPSPTSPVVTSQSTEVNITQTPLPPLYGLNNLILICTGKYDPSISGILSSARILLDILLPTAPVFPEYARLCEYTFTPAPNHNNNVENSVGMSDTSSNDGEWDDGHYRHTNDRHIQDRNVNNKQFSSYQENFRTV